MARKRALVALGALVTLGLAACGGGASGSTGDSVGDVGDDGSLEGVTLRLGSASRPDFTDVPMLRMVDKLEERGAKVEVSLFEGDQAPLRALIAGEVDFVAAGVPATIHLAEAADEGVRVFVVNLQDTDYLLVGQPQLQSLQDLSGKKVGIASAGGISDVLTRLVLRAEGVDENSVNWVTVGGTSARTAGLASGQIDAGPAHAADALAAEEQNGLKVLWRNADTVDDYLQQGLVSTKDWLASNKDVAQIIVDEMIDASRWAAVNKDEYIGRSEADIEGPSGAVRSGAYDIFKEIGMFPVNGGMHADQLNNTAQVEVDLGNIDSLPALETYTDTSFVADYLDRNGEQ